MKKTLSLMLSVALALSLFTACSSKPSTTEIDVEVAGHNGPIKVGVVFEADKIAEIKIGEHNETAGIADPALKDVPTAIIEAQSLDVDMITGATVTSKAIVEAVKLAAEKAGVTVKQTETSEKTAGEDVTADVVVVGAGLSGIMTKYEILKLNPELNVVLVEKTGNIGGALPFTGGAIVSNTSKGHKEQGVETTIDEFKSHLTLSSKDDKLNDDIIESVFGLSAETVDTLIAAGLPVKKEVSKSNPGNDKIYAYWVEGGGKEFQKFMEKFVADENLNPVFNTKVTSLVVEDGDVKGVVVEDDANFYTIHAEAVVLATGGFAKNDELVKKYIPQIPENYLMTAVDSATGDGFTLTEQFNTPVSGSGTMGTLKTADNQNPIAAQLIVAEDGKRFSDEKMVNYWIQRDFLETGMKNAYYINVETDENKEAMQKAVESGAAKSFTSLKDLAAEFKMDEEALLASANEVKLPAEGTFYVSETVFRSFGTLVGLVVNDEMEIVDGNGEEIDGLYGTGELVVSNAFSNRYPGGGFGISFAVNSGRFTGQCVVADLK